MHRLPTLLPLSRVRSVTSVLVPAPSHPAPLIATYVVGGLLELAAGVSA